MIGVHRIRIIRHGLRLAAVVVEGAQKARVLAHLIVAEVVGRNALDIAELYIGVIGAQRRPMVVGTEIDVLRPMGVQRVMQGHRFYILSHSRQNILFGLCLIAAGYVAEQAVRQGNAAGQGDRHGVDIADAAEAVRHGVDRGLVLLRQGAYIVVHLISGIAHNVYAAGLIGRGVSGDHIGGCRLRGGHGGLIGVPALTTLLIALRVLRGIVRVAGPVRLAVRGLGDGRAVCILVRRLFTAEYIGEDSQHRHHQRRGGDQKQQRAASAPLPPFIARTHPTYSLMTALAVSVSEVTHSTTQVP